MQTSVAEINNSSGRMRYTSNSNAFRSTNTATTTTTTTTAPTTATAMTTTFLHSEIHLSPHIVDLPTPSQHYQHFQAKYINNNSNAFHNNYYSNSTRYYNNSLATRESTRDSNIQMYSFFRNTMPFITRQSSEEETCEYISHLRLRDDNSNNIYTYNEIINPNKLNNNTSTSSSSSSLSSSSSSTHRRGLSGDQLVSLDISTIRDRYLLSMGLGVKNKPENAHKIEALLHHILQLQEWNRIYFQDHHPSTAHSNHSSNTIMDIVDTSSTFISPTNEELMNSRDNESNSEITIEEYQLNNGWGNSGGSHQQNHSHHPQGDNNHSNSGYNVDNSHKPYYDLLWSDENEIETTDDKKTHSYTLEPITRGWDDMRVILDAAQDQDDKDMDQTNKSLMSSESSTPEVMDQVKWTTQSVIANVIEDSGSSSSPVMKPSVSIPNPMDFYSHEPIDSVLDQNSHHYTNIATTEIENKDKKEPVGVVNDSSSKYNNNNNNAITNASGNTDHAYRPSPSHMTGTREDDLLPWKEQPQLKINENYNQPQETTQKQTVFDSSVSTSIRYPTTNNNNNKIQEGFLLPDNNKSNIRPVATYYTNEDQNNYSNENNSCAPCVAAFEEKENSKKEKEKRANPTTTVTASDNVSNRSNHNSNDNIPIIKNNNGPTKPVATISNAKKAEVNKVQNTKGETGKEIALEQNNSITTEKKSETSGSQRNRKKKENKRNNTNNNNNNNMTTNANTNSGDNTNANSQELNRRNGNQEERSTMSNTYLDHVGKQGKNTNATTIAAIVASATNSNNTNLTNDSDYNATIEKSGWDVQKSSTKKLTVRTSPLKTTTRQERGKWNLGMPNPHTRARPQVIRRSNNSHMFEVTDGHSHNLDHGHNHSNGNSANNSPLLIGRSHSVMTTNSTTGSCSSVEGNLSMDGNLYTPQSTPVLTINHNNSKYDLSARNVKSGLYMPLCDQMRFRIIDSNNSSATTTSATAASGTTTNTTATETPMIVEFPAVWERGYSSNNTAILIMSKSVIKNINAIYRELRREEREMMVRQEFWTMRCEMKLLQKGWRLDNMDYCCYPFIRVMVNLLNDQILHVAPIYLKGKAMKDPKDQKIYLSSTLSINGKETRLNKLKEKEKYIGDIVEFRYEFAKNKKYLVRDYCPLNTDITYCLCVSAFTSENKKTSKDTRELEFQAWNIHA